MIVSVFFAVAVEIGCSDVCLYAEYQDGPYVTE